uniref:FGGY family carbohydrate kinase n=1 Tax=Roseihalotalea indica TaxID=2867963 RepID=A0AA49JKH4_9BACT|nr:FGGY family carbohydrate kinase [Tunicatimonas sp. TK19036]
MPTAYLLGYDIGSSSIKACLVQADSGKIIASATSPNQELPMDAPREGWAEQHPDLWWKHLVAATIQLRQTQPEALKQVTAIGISYQMHGLVVVDQQQQVLRPSIIWCDSRAVSIGQDAFDGMGHDWCLSHLLNSPGNFTASKLKWVKENEPQVYEKIHKIMLPGDYIAMRLTGDITTTVSGLSEGVFWDFRSHALSKELLEYYKLDASLIPDLVPTFGQQGLVMQSVTQELGIPAGIPVAYRAGDQPNNALSLNVLQPGEVATTAGTSGVIYGVSDQLEYDPQSRVNSFAHVNHTQETPRYGILACVNGTGILNSWLKNQMLLGHLSYDQMNQRAMEAPIGSDGVIVLPFGNGAERPLANAEIGAHFEGIEFNVHTMNHVLRASQEGIVFALKYSLDIMSEMGMKIERVKAGKANMFLSPLFREAFANTTGTVVELYDTDGAAGAARGAGIGAGEYSNPQEAFSRLQQIDQIEPDSGKQSAYAEAYQRWLETLERHLAKQN